MEQGGEFVGNLGWTLKRKFDNLAKGGKKGGEKSFTSERLPWDWTGVFHNTYHNGEALLFSPKKVLRAELHLGQTISANIYSKRLGRNKNIL